MIHRHRVVLFGGAFTLALTGLSCSESPAAPIGPTQIVLTTSAAGAANGAVFTTQPVAAIRDAAGNTATTNTSAVTMTVSAGATVVGTGVAMAVAGVATFGGVGISGTPGTSYTLTFALGSLTSATQSITLPVTFTALRAGSIHTCGLMSAGAAYCWGSNTQGTLGDGTTTARLTPVAVQGGLVFATLTAGAFHNCGLTSAGAAYCWVSNIHGELGDATTTDRRTPTAVQGGLVFSTLAAGAFSTCGLTRAGAAYCWGFNTDGELGDGTATQRLTPVPVEGGVLTSLILDRMNG